MIVVREKKSPGYDLSLNVRDFIADMGKAKGLTSF